MSVEESYTRFANGDGPMGLGDLSAEQWVEWLKYNQPIIFMDLPTLTSEEIAALPDSKKALYAAGLRMEFQRLSKRMKVLASDIKAAYKEYM